jgi:hypothetical protein
MAKALYHKNQRVYVKPVGTWALVERVVPQWTKGLDEPIRVFYDVGLGREFGTEELQADTNNGEVFNGENSEWRVTRARNKWQSSEETSRHPFPGTYPVVVTGEAEWGGWRVPGSEYALSPTQIEHQARLIAVAPKLAALAKDLVAWGKESGASVPEKVLELTRFAHKLLAYVNEQDE